LDNKALDVFDTRCDHEDWRMSNQTLS